MVVETVAALAETAEAGAEGAEGAEAAAETSISGAVELSETLAAVEKEVPSATVNEQVDVMLQDEAFRSEILQETYPDFSEHSPFETQLPEEQLLDSDYQQFKYCNEQLRQELENGTLDTERFTERQQEQIRNGDKPEGYTWHHHQDPGRMQLVDSEIHASTPHTGGRSIWGGGSAAR